MATCCPVGVTKLVSNTDRTLSFFLEERRYALDFIVNSYSYSQLSDPKQLVNILVNLKQTMGGFVDLGLIHASGEQVCYVGPYDLAGKNYTDEDWFQEVLERGLYISDVFMGFREVPHLGKNGRGACRECVLPGRANYSMAF